VQTTTTTRHTATARAPATRTVTITRRTGTRRPLDRAAVLWSAWVVAALLALAAGRPVLYGVAVPLSALLLCLVPGALPGSAPAPDRRDLLAVGGLYAGVVALFTLAFRVFTTDRVAGLFLCFAAGLLLGVVGPVFYTVWRRGRPLAALGLRRDTWRPALGLALLFAAVQFGLTLYGYDLPAPVDWVPLLVMSLTVGVFESVFFRGFVQTRLEASFGTVPGTAGAAALYAAYHVGYGMGGREMVFLFGLGVVYAVAFRIASNLLVLWPLLTPLGAFFTNLESASFTLPWMSILGFVDVLAVMAAVLGLAVRREHRAAAG
jgi:membrane protease YdiL (CAAX protease family)